MLKNILVFIIFLHGLIHFVGFAKAFHFGKIIQITSDIPKPIGIVWALTASLFIATTILFFVKKDAWIFVGLVAVIISQILIFLVWKDAKFGTIANIIILVSLILNYGSYRFEKVYQNDVKRNFVSNNFSKTELLTALDLVLLPKPVQRYLIYAGVLNKPKVHNMRITFQGQMREKGKDFLASMQS